MKPLIGITVEAKHEPDDARSHGKLTLNWNYAEAIAAAGGVPLLIPPMAEMREVAKFIHGWLIPGGADIDAKRWGEANHSAVELQDPARYEGEASLMKHLPEDVPVLGICYGCQFLNVVRGGSLIQHLPDVVPGAHTGGVEQIYTVSDSRLGAATGASRLSGKSYHHQAVKDLGLGLEVTAKAEDGTIEAIEATDRPWMVGVQWHPERTLDDEHMRRLFETFVAQARRYAEASQFATAG